MFRDFDQSTSYDTNSVISVEHSKEDYKKKKMPGIYKEYDPITGVLVEEGQFQYGKEVGLWKVIDEDGDQQHFRYRQERIGARCGDGSFSSATGRGACSWHGGVAQWLYDNKRYEVGGTGKYEPIEERVKRTKNKLRDQLKINTNKNDLDLLMEVSNKLLANNPNPEVQEKKIEEKVNLKVSTIKTEYQNKISEMKEKQQMIESQNIELKRKNKQLKEKLKKAQKSSQNYSQTIETLNLEHQNQLTEKQRQINELKKELAETKLKNAKNKKKLQESISKSQNSNNNALQNQIKLIQQQLALLNQSIEKKNKDDLNKTLRDADEESDGSDVHDKDQEILMKKNNHTHGQKITKQSKKQESNQSKSKKSEFKIQTDPKKDLKSSNKELSLKVQQKQKQIEILNTSQQSSILPDKNEQPSLNDSLSYSKILNSKLFKDEHNRSDLSMFVDFKSIDKNTNKKTDTNTKKKGDNLVQKKGKEKIMSTKEHDQKLNKKEQSSEDEHDITLKTYSDQDQDSNEDNLQIFKSIPFKHSEIQIKQTKQSKQPTKTSKNKL